MKPLCVVSCPIDTFSGYGARARDFVKALIQLKDKEWDIKIMPQRWGECPWNFLSQDNPLRQRFIENLDVLLEKWEPKKRFDVIKIDDNSIPNNYNPNPISLTPEFIKEIQSILNHYA